MHEESSDDNGNGPEQVDENMQVGAANVHIFVGMPVEHDGAENIGDEADHADYKHDGNVDGFAVAEAFDGFEHDPNGDNGHAHGVEEGGHHFESFIAVGGGFVAVRRARRIATAATTSPVESDSMCMASEMSAREPEYQPPKSSAKKITAVKNKTPNRARREEGT